MPGSSKSAGKKHDMAKAAAAHIKQAKKDHDASLHGATSSKRPKVSSQQQQVQAIALGDQQNASSVKIRVGNFGYDGQAGALPPNMNSQA